MKTPQPQRSEPPISHARGLTQYGAHPERFTATDDKQEWPEGCPVTPWDMSARDMLMRLSPIHNAALADEREKRHEAELEVDERSRTIIHYKHKLLAAQAAIADVFKIAHTGLNEGNTCNASLIYRTLESIDLSVLDKHDVEVRNAASVKAHQDGWYEGRDYEIKLRAE